VDLSDQAIFAPPPELLPVKAIKPIELIKPVEPVANY